MKKYTKYFILSFFALLGIVLIIMGSSYSLFNYQVKGKTKNKITTGVSTEYKERILNGTDPILKDNLIPVQISDNGTVTKADTAKKWYSYQNKEWANTVILKSPSKLIGENNISGATISDNYASFDGIDDYIDLGFSNYNFGKNITMAITIFFKDTNYQTFFNNYEYGGAGFRIYSDGKLHFQIFDKNSNSYQYVEGPIIQVNEKYVIVGTYNGNELVLYINGIKINSKEVIGTIGESIMPFYLGGNPDTNGISRPSSSYVSEVAIYNEALTEDDVMKNFKSDITITNSTNLLKYVNFSSKKPKNNEVIPLDNIESYFVWIPRYKYKIFDEGNYTGLTSIESKEQVIEVVFENKDITPSNGTTVGDYLTHPAFTSFDSNGFWVGKFETGYDGATTTAEAEMNSVATDKIIIKPNTYSWRNITVGNAFKNSYDYQRNLDSHMMKNTEWGAVAYLQHSSYGSAASVRINNNSAYITGYSATVEPTLAFNATSIDGNRYEPTSIGVDGTYTVNYLNNSSKISSTTGNYTGIYDMSGGTPEYVMGYTTGAYTVGGSSGITSLYPNFFNDTNYSEYWDKYTSTAYTNYNYRILGDATGEMGPFGNEVDPDNNTRPKSSWYKDYTIFVRASYPWFVRGGHWHDGTSTGDFAFSDETGGTLAYIGYRIVLTPQ